MPFRSVLTLLLLIACATAHGQSRVYIQNNSSHDLSVQDIVISGDKLNRKAWKKGQDRIAAGKRERVLGINRTGKVNWMDPTPRFIEPGKTVVFTTTISAAQVSGGSGFQLRQKLLGTGKASKMWHSASWGNEPYDWHLDAQAYSLPWRVTDTVKLDVSYRTYKEKSDTHLEYVISDSPQVSDRP